MFIGSTQASTQLQTSKGFQKPSSKNTLSISEEKVLTGGKNTLQAFGRLSVCDRPPTPTVHCEHQRARERTRRTHCLAQLWSRWAGQGACHPRRSQSGPQLLQLWGTGSCLVSQLSHAHFPRDGGAVAVGPRRKSTPWDLAPTWAWRHSLSLARPFV